jgi:RNA polymerase sigma factor (TIGR02999 family)
LNTLSRNELTDILIASKAVKDTKHIDADKIFETIYDELRRLASSLMSRQRPDHTLQPTALVHEAYARLIDQKRIDWKDRAHFFRMAAKAMRHVLIDHARQRAAVKRGGDWQKITLDEQLAPGLDLDLEIIEIDEALTRLEEVNERMARVVEFRVFSGMTAKEVGHVLSISRRTVQEDWHVAKMWLARELAEGPSS